MRYRPLMGFMGLLLGALVLTGCDTQTTRGPLTVYADPDASPEKLANKPKPMGKASLSEHAPGISFDNIQLGHGSATNMGAPRAYTMFLWSAKNRADQTFLARSIDTAIGTGESAEFYVPLDSAKSRCVQRDFYAGIPVAILQQVNPIAPNQVVDYFVGGDEHIWDEAGCVDVPITPPLPPIPPPPPPPPPPPTCRGTGTLQFPAGSYMATFPVGFVDPWYPTNLGPFNFSIPAGSWNLTSITGDNHSRKVDEYPEGMDPQTHESAIYEFYSGSTLVGTSPATLDIPTHADTQFTNLGVMTFGQPITSIRVRHAGTSGEFPNDSFYVVSLTYACPQ